MQDGVLETKLFIIDDVHLSGSAESQETRRCSRWSNDWKGGLLRIDESVWEGKVGRTKTEGSMGYVSVPPSLEVELIAWHEQQNGKAGQDRHYQSQSLRRTFATLMQKCGTVKDAQAQLRHSSPTLTLGVYMKTLPASVREAVEVLDKRLTAPAAVIDRQSVQ